MDVVVVAVSGFAVGQAVAVAVDDVSAVAGVELVVVVAADPAGGVVVVAGAKH